MTRRGSSYSKPVPTDATGAPLTSAHGRGNSGPTKDEPVEPKKSTAPRSTGNPYGKKKQQKNNNNPYSN